MKNGFEDDTALPACCPDDAELELTVRDRVDHRLRVRDRERHRDLRVPLLELAEEERQHGLAGTRRGAELQSAAQLADRARRDVLEELLLEREQALRAAIEARARLGGLHPPPGAVEQLRPQTLLERADLQAHGRLGDPEVRRRLGEALSLDDFAEGGELPRIHKC